MHRKSQCLFALTLCLGLVACEEAPTPVATLRAVPGQITLPFPHYRTLDLEIDMVEPLGTQNRPWVMVHLLDLTGSVVRTFDHRLPGDWVTGQTQSYSIELYQSALAPPLDAGVYQLTAGLYDPEMGRFALSADAEEVHDMEYAVATVEVPQGSDDAPKFFFSPTWMATEAGTDVQILGRRWLRSDGVIRLAGVTEPGTARLEIRMAPPDPQLQDLILDEGYDEAQLDVETTCGDETWSFSGMGSHLLEVPVAPAAGEEGDGGCEIELTPHFRVVTRRNLNSRALALDLLAWRSAS